ncbi:HK97 gp10 family phage protein [Methylosinus sp. Sm6]|uniref:HK97 gp10 family phage protein n=1 Tax=Methylosinus sp. Sm6 TaxID=2866948 RepID=UPI001C997BA3|nr:HK97 gp10 family phage protein [Methylosinus sp. Sm6]MBY6242837.1 HK97 gp10 family phage protein [Methylosinus sp. Sm6]
MALPLFTIARSAFTLYSLNQATGVVGFDDVVDALTRIGLKMALDAQRVDRDALDEMVALAQERAPNRTGVLVAGIEGLETDAYFEFRASAQRERANGKPSADYAVFVEHGTAPHDDSGPGATSAFATRRRKSARRGHPGTDPQPFFYSSADEALARRGLAMDDVIPDAAQDGGWEQ